MSIVDSMPTATRTHMAPPSATEGVVGGARGAGGEACWEGYPLPASLALRLQDDDLPLDPRTWNRSEVGKWVSRRGGHPDRFPMNGKALCLMTAKMFAARVPYQPAAVALHHDFRRRLARALALQELIEEMTSK